MTREIKFRAWDRMANRMRDWDATARMHMPVISTEDNWVVMQFTGIKDKNGKEIYEGDVVTTVCDGYENRKSARVVAWVSTAKTVGFNIAGQRRRTQLQVIGNIHEHGHLLK